MKRITRQKRLRQGKGIRSPYFWGGFLAAVLLLAVTLTWLNNVDKIDLPDVPKEKSGKLIFYEALKNPEGEGAEAMPLMPDQPSPPPRPKTESRAPKAAPAPKPASAPEPAPKPAPKKAAPEKPAPAAPAPTGGNFAVQVAASKDRKAAEDLKDRLVQHGFPGYMIRENVPGKGLWYRVRVGPFEEKDEARKMKRRIEEQAKLAGILVVEKKAVTE